MRLGPRLRPVVVLAALAAAACGGSGGGQPDAAEIDAAAGQIDATPPAVDAGMPCSEPAECENPSYPVCDLAAGSCVQCLATADCTAFVYTHVCATDQDKCVECLDDGDCTGDSTALGPTCNAARGYCECANHEECRGNPNGKVCDGDFKACTCIIDDDCEPPATCEDSFYLGEGKKSCQSPG